MAYLYPIILLSFSNLFMTFAWSGHLKFKAAPLWAAVMVSWLIALAAYWLAVPAILVVLPSLSVAQATSNAQQQAQQQAAAPAKDPGAKTAPALVEGSRA